MKNHSVLLDNEAREEKFEDLMNNVLKEDTRKLIEEINEKLGSRLNPAYTQRIDAGAYLNGKEAVEAGIAHGYGTIQKTLLKDHPDAKLLFIPRIDKGMLTRRYFNRSIRSGRMV